MLNIYRCDVALLAYYVMMLDKVVNVCNLWSELHLDVKLNCGELEL